MSEWTYKHINNTANDIILSSARVHVKCKQTGKALKLGKRSGDSIYTKSTSFPCRKLRGKKKTRQLYFLSLGAFTFYLFLLHYRLHYTTLVDLHKTSRAQTVPPFLFVCVHFISSSSWLLAMLKARGEWILFTLYFHFVSKIMSTFTFFKVKSTERSF